MATLNGLLSCTIKDHLGVETSFPMYFTVADTTTLAQAITDTADYQAKLDATIDGQIIACELKLTVPLEVGIKTSPNTTAEVERNALANFSQATYKYKQGFAIPTIAEDLILNGKVNLDPALAFSIFINLLISGSTHLKYASKFLQALLALLDVVITFRKHRKRETAVSFEEA
jgi:hypothetical protein